MPAHAFSCITPTIPTYLPTNLPSQTPLDTTIGVPFHSSKNRAAVSLDGTVLQMGFVTLSIFESISRGPGTTAFKLFSFKDEDILL